MTLARLVYTIELPGRESFGLASQMQRAAVSVPSNIAEGSKRSTRKDYVHFLRTAHGSLAELETQLLLAKDLYGSRTVDEALGLLDEVSRMLSAMIGKLKL